MNRRHLTLCTLFAAATFGMPAVLQAQGATRIVVGFPAGGSADTLARITAEQLQRQMGRPFIVENRTGAAGRLAVEHVKQAAPDGETLMIVPHGPMTLFPHLYRKLRFEPAQDFTPISMLTTIEYAFIAGNAVEATDAASLKKWMAAATQERSTYGSPGAGTIPHFLGVSVARALGVSMTHVPYRGSAPAVRDVMGGVVPFAFAPVADAAEMAAAGRLKILATSGPARSANLPQTPTFKEFGMDVELDGWFALYGPAGMPAATVQALREAVATGLRDPATQARLAALGYRVEAGTPEQLIEVQRREREFWGPVVEASGFKPDE